MTPKSYIGYITIGDVVCGTGFLVRIDGLVATCNHVICEAVSKYKNGQLKFYLLDGTLFTANLLFQDEKNDIAILRVSSPQHTITDAASLMATTNDIFPGTPFSTSGYGIVEDHHDYAYISAVGLITGPASRSVHGGNIDILQINSNDLLRGLSGAPLIVDSNGKSCVAGMIAERFITRSGEQFFEHNGWGIKSEHIRRIIEGIPIDFDRHGVGVFISYSSRDQKIVARIVRDLEIRGVYKIWRDKGELKPGDKWSIKINSTINNDISHMIVCLSDSALASEHVRNEYELALSSPKGIRVIPLFLENTSLKPELLPSSLRELHIVDMPRDGYEPSIHTLIESGALPKVAYSLPEFCPIPGGPFMMGGPYNKFEVNLSEFWMARTATTIADYACFVRAGGYETDRYWLPGTFKPWQPKESLGYENLLSYAIRFPLQPMREISWYEAIAYCTWLSHVTGHPFTLPTTAQWEKAARGISSRKWANSPTWNQSTADVCEIGQMPSDVGIAGSESHYGCQDMTGQVWNWTLTTVYSGAYQVGRYDDIRDDNIASARCIRGGSWLRDKQKATVYHYETINPIPHKMQYPSEIGFRIATNVKPVMVRIAT